MMMIITWNINLGKTALIDSSSLVQRTTLRSVTAHGLAYNVACMNMHTLILNRIRISLLKKKNYVTLETNNSVL